MRGNRIPHFPQSAARLCALALTAAVCLSSGGCGMGATEQDEAPGTGSAASDALPLNRTQEETTMAKNAAQTDENAEERDALEADDTDGLADAAPLKALFADSFRMGVAVQAIDHWNDPTAEIGNPDKEALILREFNSITFGNEWKPAYNFDPASPSLYTVNPAAKEQLLWAKEHNMPVRGHTLVWHSQNDPAIFAKDFQALSGEQETHDWNATLDEDCLVDRDTLIERLRLYIRGVMAYTYQNGFADTVYAFDVVNEAVDEAAPDGLRESYYRRIIGPEYLYYCFLFAREAERDFAVQYAALYGLDAEKDDLAPILPKLFYNDYNEWFPARTEIITRFLTKDRFNAEQSLIASDAVTADGDGTIAGDGLIDGIGLQGHLDDTQNIDPYIAALRAYDEIADEVQITELDVGETASGGDAHIRQAAFYHDFFTALLRERENGVNLTSVTFWGLTDDASWRRGANPLLFAGDLSPKPAYDSIAAAARGEDYAAAAGEALRDASALRMDFEPRMEGGSLVVDTPETLGFRSRGSGHQAGLRIINTENHTAEAAVGRSLLVTRTERDATVQLDISRFIGASVHASLWVKCADSEVILGLAGTDETVLMQALSDRAGGWVLLSADFALDKALPAAHLYIETNGSGDLYIDDVEITAAE